MNIKIITFTCAKNYGGTLQAFGLYTYLKQQGHTVDFINYIPVRSNIYDKKKFVELQVRGSKIWGRSRITKLAWEILFYSSKKKGYELFSNFLKSNASFTRQYNSIDELDDDLPEADLYITGSDQVWNPQWSDQIDYPYYLTFVHDKQKKISYASSFGRDYLPEGCKETIKGFLKDYRAISVRENSGRLILSEMGLYSTVVIDPTLLCDKTVWEYMTTSVRTMKHYVVLYLIKYDDKLFKMASSYAKEEKKELVIISLEKRIDSLKMIGHRVIMPTVKDFISYIKNADAVITDSFHACVFSTIFHTPFGVYVSSRKEMSSRITEFLNSNGLDNQIITAASLFELKDIFNASINWGQVDISISNQQKTSRSWLNNQIMELGDI